MLSLRNSFVRLPAGILNDDQFLQYVYWPWTKEVTGAVIYFSSVSSVGDYYKRFIRITAGMKQLKGQFAAARIKECSAALHRRLDYRRIVRLPAPQLGWFLFYRFIRIFVSLTVTLCLRRGTEYEWFRVRQD